MCHQSAIAIKAALITALLAVMSSVGSGTPHWWRPGYGSNNPTEWYEFKKGPEIRNVMPVFMSGPFIAADRATTATQCEQACKDTLGCRSFYFGTGYLCADDKIPASLQPKLCSLFPRPFRSASVSPFNLTTAFFSPDYPQAIGGNKGAPEIPSGGWWYSNPDPLVSFESSNTNSVQCKAKCSKDPKCKGWSFALDTAGVPLCETYAVPMSYPQANEEWMVELLNLNQPETQGFGGVAANMNRILRRRGSGYGTPMNNCDDSKTAALVNQYSNCLTQTSAQGKKITRQTCVDEIHQLNAHFKTCMPLPTGGGFSNGAITDLDCVFDLKRGK